MKKLKIESIHICMEDDADPDTSTIGEWTDDLDDWNIVRETGQYVMEMKDDDIPGRGNHFRCFKPYAGGEKPGTEEYKKYGLQDWKCMEALNEGEWNYVGVYARAVVSYPTSDKSSRTETLQSGGLWGIESDSGREHFLSVVEDELEDLKSHLRAFNVVVRDFDSLAKAAKEKCTWL